MPSMWEDLKKTVKEGLTTAAAKTEEYTKIGKAKLDMMNLNKSLNGTLQDLGLEVYTQITAGAKTQPAQNPKVKGFVEKIDQLKRSIKDKEAEIEAIKKGSGAQQAGDEEASGDSAGPRTKK